MSPSHVHPKHALSSIITTRVHILLRKIRLEPGTRIAAIQIVLPECTRPGRQLAKAELMKGNIRW